MINFRKRGGETGWENGKETKGPTKFGMGSRGLKPALCTTHSSYLGCLCTVYGPTYIVPNRLTISGPRNSYSTTKLFSSRTIYIYRPLHRFGLVDWFELFRSSYVHTASFSCSRFSHCTDDFDGITNNTKILLKHHVSKVFSVLF